MADIYVRPYGEGPRNPLRFLVPVLVVAAVVGGAIWWMLDRPDTPESSEKEKPAPQTEKKEAAPEPSPASSPKPSPSPYAKPAAKPAEPSAPAASAELQRTFSRAQTQIAAGQLVEAGKLLDAVIEGSSDPSLKNNAIRVQGRVNMQLFLSETPMPEKKFYVIQPGDNLDKIARQNHTTVALLRRMNSIDGNLIYAGQRLLLPSAPFVVEVDKSDRQLRLTMNGKLFKRYAVGVGRHGKTPVGTFYTVVHQENPDWTPPSGGIVKFGDPRNVLGTRWMSFQDKARPDLKGFGIHGTAYRDSIGGETSNGCIRMVNEDVEEVFMMIPRGTKVVIQE